MASVLANVAGTVPYYCNLVGAGFSPCATNAGYTGAGAGYPINFFVANPFASGTNPGFGPPNATGQLVAAGYSNYNALQLDLRQNNWHGLQYDANYTWSHSLGVDSNNQWTGAFNAFTLAQSGQELWPHTLRFAPRTACQRNLRPALRPRPRLLQQEPYR